MGYPVNDAEGSFAMKLDLSEDAWREHLAPAGAHRASVADLRVFPTTAGDKVMAELVLKLDTGHMVRELVTVWCDRSLHDFAGECSRAKILLGQLAAATGAHPPADTDDLPMVYIGKGVEVTIAHVPKGGVLTSQIRGLRPETPTEPKPGAEAAARSKPPAKAS